MEDRQPRSTGELLSDALSILRRHFKLLYSLALPFCAVDLIIREAGTSVLQTFKNQLTQDPGSIDLDTLVKTVAGAGAGFGLIFGSAILVQVLAVGLITLTSSAWHGQTPSLADALRVVSLRAAPLVLTTLLFFAALLGLFVVITSVIVGAAVTGSMVLTVIASIAGVAAAVLALVFLTLRWGVYTQAVVLEGRFGPSAFARSTELMAGRGVSLFESAKLRLSLLFLITFAMSGTLQSLFAVPRLIVAFATGWNIADGMPPLASMPLWFIVPFGVMEVLTNALVVPFSSVLVTLFYFDLRVRFEGLDLEPSLSSSAPSISEPVSEPVSAPVSEPQEPRA